MPSVLDILTPSRVRGIVSRIRVPGNALARRFGVNVGGSNITQVSGNTHTYDIYDNVRAVARGRLPTAPAATIARNPVGNNRVVLGRTAEALPMHYQTVFNIRTIGENAGVQDRMGKRYIELQGKTVMQRSENHREFVIGSLFRGGVYYYLKSGDDLIPTYDSSGAMFGVDYQVPSTHKLIGGSFAAGLPMDTGGNLVTAAWSNIATDIPAQLVAISAGFQQSVGAPLSNCYTDSVTWLNVLNNTAVKGMAGTAAKPMAEYTMSAEKGPDGTPTGVFIGSIAGLPWLNWYIYDGGIETGSSSTYTRSIPESYVGFSVADSDWLIGVEGSEPIKDNDLAQAVEQYGLYTWIMERANPARFELHAIQNFGLEFNTPKAWAIARVR